MVSRPINSHSFELKFANLNMVRNCVCKLPEQFSHCNVLILKAVPNCE